MSLGRSTPEEAVDEFLTASVTGRLGQAGRLLAQHPGLAGHDLRTAIALGEATRVDDQLRRDPDLVQARDPRTGWTALHLACASRWHVDPARAAGLLAIVRLLLDAGADRDRRPNPESQWTPLRCAVASAGSGSGNQPIVRLLLERGATVADHDLYLAGFATGGGQWCVRLLLEHTPDARSTVAQAMAAPISLADTDGIRVLLDAGADPARYRDDDGDPANAVLAAIASGCSLELIELLLVHGADPNQPGDDGRSAYADATARGRGDLVGLLARHGARDDTTPLDRLQYACLRGDRGEALQLLARHPGLRSAIDAADGSALSGAAEAGNTEAIEVLLEVGFPIAAPAGDHAATALHAAAWAGSAETVRQLLGHGAPLEAQDSTWHATPIAWALVGSGERRGPNPDPNWVDTIGILLDAGAASDQITLDPADAIQPSAEVVSLLQARGIVPGPA